MSTSIVPSRETIRRAPKALLHDHLDGGLRPETVLELARAVDYQGLPTSDPAELSTWFHSGATRGSLSLYLEGFRHTTAVMQTPESLERVAYEHLVDLADDGVVYAELRFAPHLHTARGLGLEAVMSAVLAGCDRANRERGIVYGLLVCALRNNSPELSHDMAELAVAFRERGCVGFDLAGEEAGHPAKHHLQAFQYVKRMNFSSTIHAGESFGPESIWQALQYCGAHRIGHGTRLIEDCGVYGDRIVRHGTLAQYILDHRIPLEICLSSNLHTAAASSFATHPFPLFFRSGYRVTLNTDNRLMSRTTLTDELVLAVEHYNLNLDDIEKLTINALKSAFRHYDERCRLIFDVVKPGYDRLRVEQGHPPRRSTYIR